jgi:hypothetical protein
MRIIDQGIAVKAEEGTDHASSCFPGIAVLPGGRWLCGYRAAPKKGEDEGQHAMLTWADDEGKSWREPFGPFTPPDIDGKPGLFRAANVTALGGARVLCTLYWVDHSNPARPFFNEETEGLLDSHLFFSFSEDSGETWSSPRLLDTAPYNVPTPTTGPTLVLPNGEWALQFETNKHYYDITPWQHASVLMFTRDEGRTFPEYTVTASDPTRRCFWWDQRPGVLADGSLLDLFWTYDNVDAVYLNIQARASQDNGRTWTELWDTGVPGQPAPPVSLPDGSIGMVYMDREGAPTVKLRRSSDGGQTWPEATDLILFQPPTPTQTVTKGSMQDAWTEMGKFSTGLPATALLPNGDLLVVFYSGPHKDLTDIRWVRVGHSE